ncbi:hypothetical protein M0R45_010430 [Rubus argutus]|uniref:Transmembrane protein n=1 Tax=Rubus argutus TaxID=59490 RepID=A0AAW1Y7W8_RUBAR
MGLSFSLIRILMITLLIFSVSFLSMQSVHAVTAADPTPRKLAGRLSPPPPPQQAHEISPVAAASISISPVVA